MNRKRRSSESGMILLQVIGALLIVFAMTGLLMSMQPLDVVTNKSTRALKEVEALAEAVQRYVEDVSRANRCDFSTGLPLYKRQVALADLSALLVDPTANALGVGVAVQIPWNGPYLNVDLNQSRQHGMTISNNLPIDPWGAAYEITFSDPIAAWPDEFTIRCASPEAGSAVIAHTASLIPIYQKVTLERAEIVKQGLRDFNQYMATTPQPTTNFCNNVYFAQFTSPDNTTVICPDGIDIFEKLTSPGIAFAGKTFLPNDERLAADGRGREMKGYSADSELELDGIVFPLPTNPTVYPHIVGSKIQCTAARYRYIPTGVESVDIPLPPGAFD